MHQLPLKLNHFAGGGLGSILLIEAKQKECPDKRLECKLSKLKALIAEKKTDIIGFEDKLSQLPEKVSIMDILKGKPISRYDLEKKLYDLISLGLIPLSLLRLNCENQMNDTPQLAAGQFIQKEI